MRAVHIAPCLLVALFAAATIVSASIFTDPLTPRTPFPSEEYGYVPISATHKSAMFYALRGMDNATERQFGPLILFLQGGPGASSLFSDFLESGPVLVHATNNSQGYELRLNPNSWTKHATMLYVDNPVGTGFSYTMDPAGFSTTDDEIAANLLTFLRGFLAIHPEFVGNYSDFFIFSESYGGKMAAYFGAALADALAERTILNINFRGIMIGDGWVDPISCMKSYAPYLQGFSQINDKQARNVTRYANYAQTALESGNGTQSTFWWGVQQDYISLFTSNINWYNSLYYYDYTSENAMNWYLSTVFTAARGSLIPSGVVFNGQSNQVFNSMGGSFMKDGVAKVDHLLKRGFEVHVAGGQLDLIVNQLCIDSWMRKLTWPALEAFDNAPRKAHSVQGDQNVDLFHQEFSTLHRWEINRAGHMLPIDNAAAAELMVVKILGGDTSRVARGTPTMERAKEFVRDEAAAAKPRRWRL